MAEAVRKPTGGFGTGPYGRGPYGGPKYAGGGPAVPIDTLAISEDGGDLLVSENGDRLALNSADLPVRRRRRKRRPISPDLVAELLTEPTDAAVEVVSPEPPPLPAPRPAAIEPAWVDGRLVLGHEPARSDLRPDQLMAALAMLRGDVEDFAAELGATNADGRFIRYLRRAVAAISTTPPDQFTVFRLGHAADVLAGYANAFTEEAASAFQVEQYKNLVARFRQTVSQFPAWREFKRNAIAEELTPEQIEIAPTLARQLAAAMETEEAQVFIDRALPVALVELAEDRPAEVAGNGRDLQAADIVDSVGNVLTALAEVVVAKSKPVTDALGRGAIKGFEKVGEASAVYAAQLFVAGAIVTLMSLFPQFGWIVAVAVFALALVNGLKK
jgi:hypothetical protein